MAFDEALLETAATIGEAALRIYRWSEPTLSLGYFQKGLPPDLPDMLRRLPRVRRLSGGGAILHHREWTYSVALPKSHPLARRAESLYEAVHEALIAALAGFGISARMRGVAVPEAESSFLCFRRGDPRDVLVGGSKVIGSAQRRRRGAVLQHGSILLAASPLTPEVPGLFDLVAGLPESPQFTAAEFVEQCRRSVLPSLIPGKARPDERAFVEQAVADASPTADG